MSRAASQSTAVDAHVHVHAGFDRDRLLDHAVSNLAGAGEGRSEENPRGLLLLTETARDHVFHEFRERACCRGPQGPWHFRDTAEESSITARNASGDELILVAGRQVVTAEGLEVLALGCDAEFEDGRRVSTTLREVRDARALPVVPWGFGKWWFGRGRTVRALLESEEPSEFFLGDNSGRPRIGVRPRLFARAARRGIRVLPGSDPLPLAGQERKVGRYGFRVAGRPDGDEPAAWLKELLRRPSTRIEPFGDGERLPLFLRDQLAMQLRRRMSRGTS